MADEHGVDVEKRDDPHNERQKLYWVERDCDDGERFDIYDLDNETVVAESDELEPLVEKTNQLTPMTFEYGADNVPAW